MSPTALVVDDSGFNRLVLCRVLDRLGFQAVECCTGVEALQAFIRHGHQIACILMDINMPEMDGLEATFLIRQEEKRNARIKEGSAVSMHLEKCTQQNASVPIWAISACCEDEQRQSPVLAYLANDQRRGPLWQRAGIDDFLRKPVDFKELSAKLRLLDSGRDNCEPSSQGIAVHKAESWEDKGLKRRCSFEDSALPFAKKGLKLGMQQSSMLLTPEVAE